MSKILVTGANGFIGKSLITPLLNQGHEVYALLRTRGARADFLNHPRLHVIYGDLRIPEKMDSLPSDIDAAYYFIHSMTEKLGNLLEKEEMITKNFVAMINQTQCQQIIYLGGIIEEQTPLSVHLLSRRNVERILTRCDCPVTTLRASIVIGAGSASFKVIHDLVEKLPIMITPRWVKNLCQPIGIDDVVYYLTNCLLNKTTYRQTYDIGGPEIISFKQVLLRYAAFRNLKRWILEVPLFTPTLSSYWLVLITSVHVKLCSYLIESMRYQSICRSNQINEVIPHLCVSLEETFKRAFLKMTQEKIAFSAHSTWRWGNEIPHS
jgi:uncharacterized protein YbjT (DUF2867 family)